MKRSNLAEKNKFGLLRDKSIFAILDGDTKFESFTMDGIEEEIPICMPYLSGSTLCEISRKFGLPNSSGISRWMYLDELLVHCIENNTVSKLLAFLFSKSQFYSLLKELAPPKIDLAHAKIIKSIIEEINKFYTSVETSYSI